MTDDDHDNPSSALVRALTAGGSARELRDEEAAVAAYRCAMSRPARRGRGRLRLASGLGATAVASAFVMSATVVTAAAYTAALPQDAQRTAHRLLHRLGVPGPAEHAHHSPPAGAVAALPGGAARRGHLATAPARRSPQRVQPAAALPALEVRLDRAVVAVGGSVRIEVEEHGALPPAVGVVQVEGRSPGARTWSVLGRARLQDQGGATLVFARVEHALEVRAVLPVRNAEVIVSAPRELHARPSLSLRAEMAPSGSRRLTLRTDAGQRARVVVFQEQIAGVWRDLGRSAVGADGSAVFRLPVGHGHYLFRAALGDSTLFDAAVSSVVAVDVP